MCSVTNFHTSGINEKIVKLYMKIFFFLLCHAMHAPENNLHYVEGCPSIKKRIRRFSAVRITITMLSAF